MFKPSASLCSPLKQVLITALVRKRASDKFTTGGRAGEISLTVAVEELVHPSGSVRRNATVYEAAVTAAGQVQQQ